MKKFKLENPERRREINQLSIQTHREKVQFPPNSPSMRQQHKIIPRFCKEVSLNQFEAGCAVCGRLTPVLKLHDIKDVDLKLLIQNNVTQKQSYSDNKPLMSFDNPVLLEDLNRTCNTCLKSLSNGKRSAFSLANGL